MKKVQRIFFNEDTVEVNYGFTGEDKGTWFLEHCELLQFSGGYDSHHKQIFEGDILECLGDDEYKEKNGKYICVFNDDCSFALVPELYFNKGACIVGLPLNWGGFKSKKIIGNIFKNSELLKESI